MKKSSHQCYKLARMASAKELLHTFVFSEPAGKDEWEAEEPDSPKSPDSPDSPMPTLLATGDPFELEVPTLVGTIPIGRRGVRILRVVVRVSVNVRVSEFTRERICA